MCADVNPSFNMIVKMLYPQAKAIEWSIGAVEIGARTIKPEQWLVRL